MAKGFQATAESAGDQEWTGRTDGGCETRGQQRNNLWCWSCNRNGRIGLQKAPVAEASKCHLSNWLPNAQTCSKKADDVLQLEQCTGSCGDGTLSMDVHMRISVN